MPDLIITGQAEGPCGCCGGEVVCPDCNYVGLFFDESEFDAEAALYQFGENWIRPTGRDAAWTGPIYTPASNGYSFSGTNFATPFLTAVLFAVSQYELASGNLTLDYNVAVEENLGEVIQVQLRLYNCTSGTLIASDSFISSAEALSASGSLAVVVPAAGQYRIEVSMRGGRGESDGVEEPECLFEFDLSHEDAITAYPVCHDVIFGGGGGGHCGEVDCEECDPEMCGQEGNPEECNDCCCD